jgi:hypothetical protein
MLLLLGPVQPINAQTTTTHFAVDGQPRSSPPEGFFDFAGDVAPREANVVQVQLGQSSEFLTRPVALPPDVQGLA